MDIHQLSKHSKQQYWKTDPGCRTASNFLCASSCVRSMQVYTYACLLQPETVYYIHTNQGFSIVMLLTTKIFEIVQDEINT